MILENQELEEEAKRFGEEERERIPSFLPQTSSPPPPAPAFPKSSITLQC